ncbi:hypothetical protein C8J35_103509 [Rhizobium sp. PP-F2F-G38]|nr:hypothetical protein C8J35_103509 [Rhizobium sp. PP-F2F-G38]
MGKADVLEKTERFKFYISASSYWHAARCLVEHPDFGSTMWRPALNMLCTSVELILKSHLIKDGCSERELRDHGHDMERLLTSVLERGVTLCWQETLSVLIMHELYGSHLLRYPGGRPKKLYIQPTTMLSHAAAIVDRVTDNDRVLRGGRRGGRQIYDIRPTPPITVKATGDNVGMLINAARSYVLANTASA